jgi:purine-nucleoside/S-methyl-5'-thioadenosine phosphorylase / adenosine deaminase
MIQPQPDGTFEWSETRARTALVCHRLESVARHAFTTRPWHLGSGSHESAATGWDEVAKAIDVESRRVVRMHQVHGASVVVQRAGRPIAPTTDADIMITDDPSVALAVQTADCVPLLVADSSTGTVAAAHAGWRGIALRVPSVTVAALVEQLGSRASDLVAAIGPSIGSCCYEVGADVRQRFEAEGFSSRALERWFLVESAESATNPRLSGLSKRAREGHWFFDIWTATRDLLMEAGIPPGQVFAAQLCTASHADAFCSYRRDGSRAGRMAAVIRSTRPAR